MFGGWTWFSTVDILMGTNCTRRLVPLFDWDKLHIGTSQESKTMLTRSFNFTFRYTDDVISRNYSRFGNYVDRVLPIKLEIKNITYTALSTSYLDLHIEIDSEHRLRKKHYDKRYNFNFPIVNFPFITKTIPAAPAYWVEISNLIRYSRACGSLAWEMVAANKEDTEPRVPSV